MSDTAVFLALSAVSALSISPLIVRSHSENSTRQTASAFYWITIVLSMMALLWVILDALGRLPRSAQSPWLFRLLIYRGWVVIGTAVSCAILLAVDRFPTQRSFFADATRAFVASSNVLNAICFSISLSFFSAEIGKLAHHAEMRQFFLQSGYPVWFLCFTIVAETTGATSLFIPRLRSLGACGLSVLMMGAIATHARNHDPFSDSLEALHLLVLLLSVLVIRLIGKHGLPRRSHS